MHPGTSPRPPPPLRDSPKLPSRRSRYSWDVPWDLHPPPAPPEKKSQWQERMTISAASSAHEEHAGLLAVELDPLPPGVAARSGWGTVDCYGYGVRFFTPTSPGTRCNPIRWHHRALETGTARVAPSPRPSSARAAAASWAGSEARSRPRRNSALSQPPPPTTRLPIDSGTWRTPLRPCMRSPRMYLSASAR